MRPEPSLPDPPAPWQRVALLLEYDGAAFHGSQFQPGLPTVQGALMDALTALNVPFARMLFAGRTDAGVHALGQVAHVDVPEGALGEIPHFQTALNACLPPTVAVRQVAGHEPGRPVDPRFHSLLYARAKWYRYQLHLSPQRSLGVPPGTAWWNVRHRPLDIGRMQAAAALLVGRHDFTGFQGRTRAALDPVCQIMDAGFTVKTAENGEFPGQILIFDIVGTRFLYKMVRNLMGHLLVMGQATPERNPDWQDPAHLQTVLFRQDKSKAAPAAAPQGLTLMAVHYEPCDQYFQSDPVVRQFNQRWPAVCRPVSPNPAP